MENYKKYLKYKNKYLELKNIINMKGGMHLLKTSSKNKCQNFVNYGETISYNGIKDLLCQTCNQAQQTHQCNKFNSNMESMASSSADPANDTCRHCGRTKREHISKQMVKSTKKTILAFRPCYMFTPISPENINICKNCKFSKKDHYKDYIGTMPNDVIRSNLLPFLDPSDLHNFFNAVERSSTLPISRELIKFKPLKYRYFMLQKRNHSESQEIHFYALTDAKILELYNIVLDILTFGGIKFEYYNPLNLTKKMKILMYISIILLYLQEDINPPSQMLGTKQILIINASKIFESNITFFTHILHDISFEISDNILELFSKEPNLDCMDFKNVDYHKQKQTNDNIILFLDKKEFMYAYYKIVSTKTCKMLYRLDGNYVDFPLSDRELCFEFFTRCRKCGGYECLTECTFGRDVGCGIRGCYDDSCRGECAEWSSPEETWYGID